MHNNSYLDFNCFFIIINSIHIILHLNVIMVIIMIIRYAQISEDLNLTE